MAIKMAKQNKHYAQAKIETHKDLNCRDYDKNPPQESLAIEIMRLERKLPGLSLAEGERLSLLYEMTKPT